MNGEKQFDFGGLKQKLEVDSFPRVYLFKFIVPSDNRSIALLEALFTEEAQITLRASKTGKYTSLGGKEVMLSADSIIDKYKAALKIEGCIAL